MNQHQPNRKEFYQPTITIPGWSWALAITLAVAGWIVIIVIATFIIGGLS